MITNHKTKIQTNINQQKYNQIKIDVIQYSLLKYNK